MIRIETIYRRLSVAVIATCAAGCATNSHPDFEDAESIRKYLKADAGGFGASEFHFHRGNIGPDSLGRPTNFGVFTTPIEGS